MVDVFKYILNITQQDKELAWGYTSTDWTALSAVSTAVGTVVVICTAGIALWGMQENRRINRENNEIQRDRVLQERLIELSHEWNSKDFIHARNEAALLKGEFKDRERKAYPVLSENRRLIDWIYISMIAHFFERLSYIQLSKQIYRKNAILEFKEAIEYWHDFLFEAYRYDEDEGLRNEESEKRMCDALKALRDEYRKSEEESDIP